jgi:deoxycytidylate deaminase
MAEELSFDREKYFIDTKRIDYLKLTVKEQLLVTQLNAIRMLSPAVKKKVGAIIGDHKTGVMLSIGYNKMFDSLGVQRCEDDVDDQLSIPYVIHAEEQAAIHYMKMQNRGNLDNMTMYVSYAPCLQCSKMTAHVGIHRLLFIEKHETKFDIGYYSPRAFLHRMGTEVLQVVNIPEIK